MEIIVTESYIFVSVVIVYVFVLKFFYFLFLFFISGKAYVDWTHTLSLWCLNPAVVFRDIGDLSLSVILTSG